MKDIFKPMLATDADLTKLRFPLLASPKLDGIRAVVRGGVVYSRSNKPIPNKYVQEMCGQSYFEHFDGELTVGLPWSKTVYRDTVSHVMSNDKRGFEFCFHVFDHIANEDLIYRQRHDMIVANGAIIKRLEQRTISNLGELLAFEEAYLNMGYEGLILRDPNAPYKRGRSTVKEGYLLKLKRFTDAEATVTGFEERQHNANEKTTNELGRTARSSHQAGKVGMDTLGAINVSFGGMDFSIGTGFTDAERAEVWANRGKYVGKLAKFKYFAVGMKDAPRHPVFLGWRDAADL